MSMQNNLRQLRQLETPTSLPTHSYKIFLCDYSYNERLWSVDIPATSLVDADKRLNAIIRNGRIVGQKERSLPVPLFRRFYNWLGKLLFR